MTRQFKETELVASLARLTPRLRTAFAAACAERLLPAYRRYSDLRGDSHARELALLVEQLWAGLIEGVVPADIDSRIESCMALVPSEDAGPRVEGQSAAEDAVAAVAYALTCWKTGESRDAGWAARCAYEVLDEFIINTEGIDVNRTGAEREVLAHPLMQTELMRQERDLADLLSRSQPAADFISQLRDQARIEANVFFG